MNKNTRTYKRQRASDNAMFPSSSMPFLLSIQPLPSPSPLSSTLWFCLPPRGQKALTTLIVMSVQGSKGVGGGVRRDHPIGTHIFANAIKRTCVSNRPACLPRPPLFPFPFPVLCPTLIISVRLANKFDFERIFCRLTA